MKYNYLLFALATVAFFSCTGKEAVDPESEGELVTIRAYQEGATETRTTLIDGGTQVYWEPSDEIKVFFRGSGSRFTSQNTSNADVAEFSGSLNVVVGINEGASGSNTLWGLYPYRADATSEGESVTTTLPVEQTGRAGSFAKGTHITLAQSNSFDLAFYNVTGGIRFSLTQEGVKEVVFEGLNNEDIAGKVKLAFADGVPVVKEVIEGKKSITLSAPYSQTFETGKWYYIIVLPGTLNGGFKMTFNTATQTATLKSSGPKSIKRGIFGSLADADEGLIYKDKGGDEPQTGNIVFADPAAKYACVAKFDTNGDGEVSYEEAEAATSFSGLFNDWKGVVSFDEIRYFKNVHSLSGVFKDCNKLVSITVPESITDLGSYAFSGCSSLSSVILPSGITAIGSYTFQKCSSLESVEIPSNVTFIGQEAFSDCGMLRSIVLPSEVTAIADDAFFRCGLLESIELPSSIISIGQYAFCGCDSLESIILPSHLKTIGEGAFSGCSSITQVVIPEGITSIPKACFMGCSSLTSVSVPVGVTSIKDNAFSQVRMWKLELPSSITSLGHTCFDGIICIVLPSTSIVTIQSNTFDGVQGIFIPSNMIDMYKVKTNWTNYSSKLHAIGIFKEKSEFTFVTRGVADMGTSVKWSAYNVGASKPEEFGDYYAWGETETKSEYSWRTYHDSPNGDGQSFTKYYFGEGGKTILDLEDDVAHVKLGGTWRIPTYEEWLELLDVCMWEWTTYQEVIGFWVYSLESGKSVFLPSAGRWDKAKLGNVGYQGLYWSSSLEDNSGAYCVILYSGVQDWSSYGRCYGFPIRPVCTE